MKNSWDFQTFTRFVQTLTQQLNIVAYLVIVFIENLPQDLMCKANLGVCTVSKSCERAHAHSLEGTLVGDNLWWWLNSKMLVGVEEFPTRSHEISLHLVTSSSHWSSNMIDSRPRLTCNALQLGCIKNSNNVTNARTCWPPTNEKLTTLTHCKCQVPIPVGSSILCSLRLSPAFVYGTAAVGLQPRIWKRLTLQQLLLPLPLPQTINEKNDLWPWLNKTSSR